jgi:hypothetical protein
METKLVRHGEVILKAVDNLPKEAKLVEATNSFIVAHSETGHNHRLVTKEKTDLSKFKVYSWNGETYLEVPAISELLHEKSGKDAHKTHTIQPNIYKVILKKEFDYYKSVMRNVRD